MAVIKVNEHKNMKYKVGDTVVLRLFDISYKRYKKDYSHKTAKIVEIKIYQSINDEIRYILDIDKGTYSWFDSDIDHEATERLNKPVEIKTIFLTMPRHCGRSFYEQSVVNLFADLKNCKFKQIQPKRVIPNKGDQYLFVDLADENLYGIGYWLNDATDFHMLKLGLIKDTAQECVKMAKEMLKKLDLEV